MSIRRFLLMLVLSPVLIVLAAMATWAYWTTSGAGTGSASAGTINAPTAAAASNTPGSPLVVVSWTNSAPAGGVSPTSYYVTRVRNSDSATSDACGSSPASPTATTPCNDTSVPDGTYHYVVTGVLASWTATSGSSNDVAIDATAPTVTGVSSPLVNGSYKAGQVIPVTVTFSEVVTVTGTAQLALSTGSPATTTVNYSFGSGTSVLTFNYTVAGGNTSPVLDYTSVNSLLAGNKIHDLATNDATLTLASPGAAGSLGANKNLVIDTTAPTVTGVSSPLVDGSYKAGQVIPVTVTFSESVTVTGTPQLALSTGSPATTAVNYTSGTGTGVLTFNYTVAAGNTSFDLNYVAATSLALNGGTLQDLVTNNATLTLAAPAAANSLGANKNLVIDTTAPTVAVTSVNGSVRTFPYSTNVNVTSIGGTCGNLSGDSATVNPQINGAATVPAVATCSAGAWTLTLTTALTVPATYSLSVTQTDAAGNTGSATSLTLTIDKTAPVAATAPVLTAASDSGSSSSDRITNVTAPTFIGTAEAGATITLYNGVTLVGTAVATGGAYSITSSALTDGAKTMTVKATDAAGNVGPSSTNTSITIDTTPPTLVFSSCTGGQGHRNTFVGTTNDNAISVSVKIFIGNGTAGTLLTTLTAPPSGGSWTVATSNNDLVGGAPYTAQATQVDTAGNSLQPTCGFNAN